MTKKWDKKPDVYELVAQAYQEFIANASKRPAEIIETMLKENSEGAPVTGAKCGATFNTFKEGAN